MPTTVAIGTPCFVFLNGTVYTGIVIGFYDDPIKGRAVTVETDAAREIYRPWKRMSFWMRDCTGVAAKHCTMEVPTTDARRAELQHAVDNPPLSQRIQWLAQQAGELPLSTTGRERKLVPQFPEGLDQS